jgi:hypothetical protein
MHDVGNGSQYRKFGNDHHGYAELCSLSRGKVAEMKNVRVHSWLVGSLKFTVRVRLSCRRSRPCLPLVSEAKSAIEIQMQRLAVWGSDMMPGFGSMPLHRKEG